MSYPQPHSWQVGHPVPDPVSRGRIILAGAVDQLVMIGTFLLCFGLGLLLADTADGRSGLFIGVGLVGGMLVTIVAVAVQMWLAIRRGSTAGLFLMGIRFDPRLRVDWYDDAADWLLCYWYNLLLAPLGWLVSKVAPKWSDNGQGTGFVLDPRARSAGARLTRTGVAIFVVAAPVPLVFAIMA